MGIILDWVIERWISFFFLCGAIVRIAFVVDDKWNQQQCMQMLKHGICGHDILVQILTRLGIEEFWGELLL